MFTIELDPAKREWEYDDTGQKIYKLEAGYGTKTPYPKEKEKWNGTEEPYYVDLP